jgi:hypothetical protein
MEIYTSSRKPLHEPALSSDASPAPTLKQKAKHVPAKRKRVTEYWVLHNRLWVDPSEEGYEGWVVKNQMWPTVGKEVAV